MVRFHSPWKPVGVVSRLATCSSDTLKPERRFDDPICRFGRRAEADGGLRHGRAMVTIRAEILTEPTSEPSQAVYALA